MSWERGAGFRIVGALVRDPFIAASGKFAKMSLGVPGQRGEVKHEVRAFNLDVIEEIRGLGIGQTIQVTGTVDSECLKDKKGVEVMVDGYKCWVERLTAKEITVEGASVKPAAAPPKTDEAATDGW